MLSFFFSCKDNGNISQAKVTPNDFAPSSFASSQLLAVKMAKIFLIGGLLANQQAGQSLYLASSWQSYNLASWRSTR
jgi:hypothetical protein